DRNGAMISCTSSSVGPSVHDRSNQPWPVPRAIRSENFTLGNAARSALRIFCPVCAALWSITWRVRTPMPRSPSDRMAWGCSPGLIPQVYTTILWCCKGWMVLCRGPLPSAHARYVGVDAALGRPGHIAGALDGVGVSDTFTLGVVFGAVAYLGQDVP